MTIRTSRGRSLLVALVAAGGVRALALCELPTLPFVIAACAVMAFAAHDFLRPRVTLLSMGADGLWHVLWSSGERVAGRLADAGYRSSALLVLVLEEECPTARAEGSRTDVRADDARERPRTRRGRRRRVTVFADSVDARDFSFLHLQLAFPGHDR